MTGQIFFESSLTQTDPMVLDAIEREYHRQNDQIELIASENIVSKAVLEAQGTILTNKYAEGYSGKRYYGGCEHVDVVEDICIDRIKKLFNASFVLLRCAKVTSHMKMLISHLILKQCICAFSVVTNKNGQEHLQLMRQQHLQLWNYNRKS